MITVAMVGAQQLFGPSSAAPGVVDQPSSSGDVPGEWSQVAGDSILTLDDVSGSSWRITVSPGDRGQWCIDAHTATGTPPEPGDLCDQVAGPGGGETFGSGGSQTDADGVGLWWGATAETVDEVWVAFDDGTMREANSAADETLGFGVYAFHAEGEERLPVRIEARQDGEAVGSRAIGEAAAPDGRIATFCEEFAELDQAGPPTAPQNRADGIAALHELAPPAAAEPLAVVRDFHATRDSSTDPSYDEMPIEVQRAIDEVDAYVATVCAG